ncbi:MAG: rod shape-determining protein MreC [Arenimonas sp.]
MVYASSSAKRFSDSASETLPLLAYLILASVLMLSDYRMNIGVQARAQLSGFIEPVWWLAALPSRMWSGVDDELATRQALQDSNERLIRELQIVNARMQRMRAVNDENQRLRDLLNASRNGSMQVQMVSILDVDLNPYRQRIVLNAGTNQGVKIGQAIMDAGGILGQVIEVSANKSTALLVTDADHAIPVQVARSGFRSIAFGTGEPSTLVISDIPQSADIRKGDVLVTSGMGGRFPAGFPVATIESLNPNETGLFMVGTAKPAARLDRGLEVLLLNEIIPSPPALPPPTPASTSPLVEAPAATVAPTTTKPPVEKPTPAKSNPVETKADKPPADAAVPATDADTDTDNDDTP